MRQSINLKPVHHHLNPYRVRKHIAFAAIISIAVVIYGSLLPLDFRPMPLDQVITTFSQIPWYELGVTKRADWFANGLLLVPTGFLFTGALSYRRKNLTLQAIITSVVIFFIAALVCFIEVSQIFFPPRVLSLNDMAAGFIGGLLGWALWHGIGDYCLGAANRFSEIPRGLARFTYLSNLIVIGIILSSILPLDIIFNWSELHQKYLDGKICLIPFYEISGFISALKILIHASWVVPMAYLWQRQLGSEGAMRRLIICCVAAELLTLPIFGRYTSTTDIILPVILGLCSIHLSPAINTAIVSLNKPNGWYAIVVIWILLLLYGLCGQFQTVVLNPEDIRPRMDSFLSVPYASAQRSTEFQAIENIAIKASLFCVLGFTMQGAHNLSFRRSNQDSFSFIDPKILTWILLTATSIECLQIFLVPLIPEVSDIITYSLGGVSGAMLCNLTQMAPKKSA